jgi:hypothetical protein
MTRGWICSPSSVSGSKAELSIEGCRDLTELRGHVSLRRMSNRGIQSEQMAEAQSALAAKECELLEGRCR